jgi:hypothetical protein
MGGEALPELVPDTRHGWVEKWLYLAAEEREAAEQGGDAGDGGEPAEEGRRLDELARRLGAMPGRGGR